MDLGDPLLGLYTDIIVMSFWCINTRLSNALSLAAAHMYVGCLFLEGMWILDSFSLMHGLWSSSILITWE